MDQLRSIGVEFDSGSISRVFSQADRYYRLEASKGATEPQVKESFWQRHFPFLMKSRVLHWAMDPIFESNFPIRPWALGQILKAKSPLYVLAGKITRSPGMYKRVDSFTGRETTTFLEDTNERIHPSVRVRLAVKGLGLDDQGLWECPALLKNWRLRQTTQEFDDPIPRKTRTWDPQDPDLTGTNQVVITDPDEDTAKWGGRWVWEYVGPEHKAPRQRLLVEEPLGPYESYLLKLSAGYPNVFEFAAEHNMLA